MRRLALFAVVAAARATDDAAARRRLCATDLEGGFGSGRWVEGADDAARALAAQHGLAPDSAIVRWHWAPDRPECALRAPRALLARAGGGGDGGAPRAEDALCDVLERASARVVLSFGDSIQSSFFKQLWYWTLPRHRRGRELFWWKWGGFGDFELACRGGWNVSFVHLSTHMVRGARSPSRAARERRRGTRRRRAPRFRESMRARS